MLYIYSQMEKSKRQKLMEDLEYWHKQGDVNKDEFKIGVEEGEFEVAQDRMYAEVRVDVENSINYLVDKHIPTFGDRNSALGAILAVIEKQYL